MVGASCPADCFIRISDCPNIIEYLNLFSLKTFGRALALPGLPLAVPLLNYIVSWLSVEKPSQNSIALWVLFFQHRMLRGAWLTNPEQWHGRVSSNSTEGHPGDRPAD